MAPSTSSTFCCCNKYFRRQPASPSTNITQSHRAIEIKVNGESHLTVPHVALPRATTNGAQNNPAKNVEATNGDTNNIIGVEQIDATYIQVEEDEVAQFETARTSRQTDDAKIISMSELFRKVRIEEGLEVTPRVAPAPALAPTPTPTPKEENLLQTTVPLKKSLRKAVFNEEGDITTRTIESSKIRKLSVASLVSLPVIQLPPMSKPKARMAITRKMSAAPQVITAFFALTYACLTGLLTAITNIFIRV